MLVTLQSSLPDLFYDTRFTVGQPDHFPNIYGSGSGSHTHLKKFMRLLSVHWSSFPQLKLVESAGNAPASACWQASGTPSWCRPKQAGFWRPSCASWRTAQGDLNLPWAAATPRVAVRKDLPARAISIKNKHLLAIYAIPTRGFTAAVSVFRGTPPAKPLNCHFG